MSRQKPPPGKWYGPAGFIAAVITMTIGQTATWVWIPGWIYSIYIFGAFTLLVFVFGVMFSSAPRAAPIGRGIFIGYLATPLTVVIAAVLAGVVSYLT